MLLKNQNDISLQRGMPVDPVSDSQKVVSQSEASVQLYYYNSGVLTTDAGQAAGVAVVAKLLYAGILTNIGDVIGSKNDHSLAFTSTALTTEVAIDFDTLENADASTGSDKLNGIISGFTNGQYCVDYRTGTIYGKKASNQTALTTVTYKTSTTASNVTLEASDIEIGAVELKDGTTDNRASIDATGALKVTGGASSVSAQYISPADFNVAYTSASTITLSGVPFTIATGAQVVYIKIRNSATNVTSTYVAGANGYGFGHSAGVITAYLNGSATSIFSATDMYEVGLNEQEKAFDPSTNSRMTTSLKNVWNQYTDGEVLVTAQDLTNAYADFGAEIDMRGYDTLSVYIITDVNSSENVNLKALAKHTPAGADEYELGSSGIKTLWTTGASDSKLYYEFETNGIPYVQLQAIAGTVGATAGDLTISIIKMKK